jgi:hypothetical protein
LLSDIFQILLDKNICLVLLRVINYGKIYSKVSPIRSPEGEATPFRGHFHFSLLVNLPSRVWKIGLRIDNKLKAFGKRRKGGEHYEKKGDFQNTIDRNRFFID